MDLRSLGATQSLSRHQLGRQQLRQGLRRTGLRRRPAGARTEWPRADLPQNPRLCRGGPCRPTDLEQPGMNGLPVLTLLTVLPLVGAAIALVSSKHARDVALLTTLAGLALSLYIWTQLPANGAI